MDTSDRSATEGTTGSRPNRPASRGRRPAEVPGTGLAWMTLVVALVTTAGSIYLSVGAGLIACPLCFYQRTFAMGVLGVLAVGLPTGAGRAMSLSALTLPLAVAGLAVAGFHVHLEQQGTLECPRGLFGLATAPVQSLICFAVLTALLLAAAVSDRRAGAGFWPACGGVALGLLFAFLCVRSAPPLPPAPEGPYDPAKQPLNTCRRPFGSAP